MVTIDGPSNFSRLEPFSMRLRLIVLVASALLSLVPALAFADDDSADSPRVALTAAPSTAPTATADADDDRSRCAAHPEACADQIAKADAERVKFCALHPEACADQVMDRAEDRAAWCQNHPEACAARHVDEAQERAAFCAAHPKACAAAAEHRP